MKFRIDIPSKEVVKKMHLEDKMTMKDMAKELNIGTRVVKKILAHYDINIVNNYKQKRPNRIYKKEFTNIGVCGKQWIEENCLTVSGNINPQIFHKIDNVKLREINKITSFLPLGSNISLRINCILNNITEIPKCPTCKIENVSVFQNRRFNFHCSSICGVRNPQVQKKKVLNTDYKKISEKRSITNMKKYGNSSYLASDIGKIKTKNTNIKKYGVEYISQVPEIKAKSIESFKRHLSDGSVKIKYYDNIFWENNKDSILELIDSSIKIKDIAKRYNIAYSTLYNILHRNDKSDLINLYNPISSPHQKILNCLDVKHVVNDRSVITPQELDIYFPDNNLAIEVNGIYWHSFKEKMYHFNKTQKANISNVELLHFTDVEIYDKFDIVMSIINNKLGKSERIFGRNCVVYYPNKTEEREFFNQNHINGFSGSSVCIALKYNSKIVQMMSFGKSRFSRNHQYEMIRSCGIIGKIVVGGIGKLFKDFVINNSPVSIVSYADLRFGEGESYKKLGFTHSHNTSPNYWYFKRNEYILYNRIKFQKHKLKNLLDVYDPTLSESANMTNNGYLRIYDCGNNVWSWKG